MDNSEYVPKTRNRVRKTDLNNDIIIDRLLTYQSFYCILKVGIVQGEKYVQD